VCDLEAGRIPSPNLRTLQKIARALDVEVYDLLVRPATPAGLIEREADLAS
jgi:DNA-binding Xre family transcriptional regulator